MSTQPQSQSSQDAVCQKVKGKTDAILSLVFGIINLFFMSIVFGPLALIFGVIALVRTKSWKYRIISIIGILAGGWGTIFILKNLLSGSA